MQYLPTSDAPQSALITPETLVEAILLFPANDQKRWQELQNGTVESVSFVQSVILPYLNGAFLTRWPARMATKDFVNHQDIHEYVDDTGANWEPDEGLFELKTVSITSLEKAFSRPLLLYQVDMDMVGQTRTYAPLILDSDLSVIDGMHRLADALLRNDETLQAYVRIP